jgi:peptide/nickel transport system substrate-binding protein
VNNKPGVSTLMKKFPNFWNDKRGHFDEVKVVGISDVVARTNALLTGKVDVISDPDLKTIKMLAKSPKVKIIQVPSKKHHLFVMNTTVAPYNNNDLRLALKYAINRKEIVDKVLGGYGTVGNDHPISPSYPFYASKLTQREFDPDKAKFHLKKAGMEGDTFTLSVANAPFGGAVDTAMLYQQQAAKAGVNIKIDRAPDDGYWKNVWMKKPFCASKWSGRLNEDMMLTTAYTTGAPWNETFWTNQKFDKVLKEARTEKDDSKRAEMYAECQKLINEEGGSIIPVFTDFIMAASNKIGHGKVSGSWQMDGFLAAERWWFE